MARDTARGGERDRVRDALERATEGREPEMGHYLETIPEMMAEAGRRRRARENAGIISACVPLARRAIPGMAVAAAVLLVMVLVVVLRQPAGSFGAPERLEAMMLGQNGGELTTEMILRSVAEPGEEP